MKYNIAMKNRLFLAIIVLAASVGLRAEQTNEMMHILKGGYDAKVMTQAEMDSVLGNGLLVMGDISWNIRISSNCFVIRFWQTTT